ncbi:MAG: hypothetical protein EBX77_04170, partial [Actinobacteria bacterium]|nr:hypothetical protein [Actinomycetota bacterium]
QMRAFGTRKGKDFQTFESQNKSRKKRPKHARTLELKLRSLSLAVVAEGPPLLACLLLTPEPEFRPQFDPSYAQSVT